MTKRKLLPFLHRERCVERVREGLLAWNRWRSENPGERADLMNADLNGVDLSGPGVDLGGEEDPGAEELRGLDLSGANLCGASLRDAKLRAANFTGAVLDGADFRGADLSEADFTWVNLSRVDLRGARLRWARLAGADLRDCKLDHAQLVNADLNHADLTGASLQEARLLGASLDSADLSGACLDGADLTGAGLAHARLVGTKLRDAILDGCRVYGIAAWDVDLEGARQKNLVITPPEVAEISVDDLKVAQFVYLLVYNPNLRDVIDTVGTKAVLILGRFTPERKAVLQALREGLRRLGFVPLLFDFAKPEVRDFTETVRTLAGMCRFVVADITNPKSGPLELQATIPETMIPFVTIIQQDEEPFSMFRDLWIKYRDWVLEPLEYDSADRLLRGLETAIVRPALERHERIVARKAETPGRRRLDDYLPGPG